MHKAATEVISSMVDGGQVVGIHGDELLLLSGASSVNEHNTVCVPTCVLAMVWYHQKVLVVAKYPTTTSML